MLHFKVMAVFVHALSLIFSKKVERGNHQGPITKDVALMRSVMITLPRFLLLCDMSVTVFVFCKLWYLIKLPTQL